MSSNWGLLNLLKEKYSLNDHIASFLWVLVLVIFSILSFGQLKGKKTWFRYLGSAHGVYFALVSLYAYVSSNYSYPNWEISAAIYNYMYLLGLILVAVSFFGNLNKIGNCISAALCGLLSVPLWLYFTLLIAHDSP